MDIEIPELGFCKCLVPAELDDSISINCCVLAFLVYGSSAANAAAKAWACV